MTVTDTADLKIVSMTVDAPAQADVGVPFPVTINEVLHNNGPYGPANATVSFSLSAPADCVLNPPGAQSQNLVLAVSQAVNVSATWSVTCSTSSNHEFNATNTLTLNPTLHVSDPSPASATASATTAVFANADLKVVSVSVPPVIVVGEDPPITVTVVTHNNGPDAGMGSTTVTLTGTCVIIGPASQTGAITAYPVSTSVTQTFTFNIDLPASGPGCSYTATAVLTPVAALHSQDPNGGNNSGNATSTLVRHHDDDTKYVTLVGPAAINLSDTNGRYMWVISEIGNFSNHIDSVLISIAITPNVPAGCTRTIVQILPGQTTFLMASKEQKFLVWRVRYECHSPATEQVISQTVTVCVNHQDTGNGDEVEPPQFTVVTPHNHGTHIGIKDCASATRSIIIDQP
jgi:hypothetical protein